MRGFTIVILYIFLFCITTNGKKLPLDKAPIIITDDKSKIADELVPGKGKPLNFTVPGVKMMNPINVVLQPFYQIHDSRYMMYRKTLTHTQDHSYEDSVSNAEKPFIKKNKRR
jgi:hypothetical protein